MSPEKNRMIGRLIHVLKTHSAIVHSTVGVMILSLCVLSSSLPAQDSQLSGLSGIEFTAPAPRKDQTPANVLSPAESRRVEDAVERALVFLASQQQPDGSFPTLPHGQPAVTSLCVLAYMAHGHLPGEGPHGQRLEAAADFIMSCQKENGLITLYGPDGPRITRDVSHEIGSAATYNHSIASLALSEMYGMSQTKRAGQMQRVINKSLAATLEMQRWRKDAPYDQGGWRYVDDFDQNDSDLSVTGWYLMSLRSAQRRLQRT